MRRYGCGGSVYHGIEVGAGSEGLTTSLGFAERTHNMELLTRMQEPWQFHNAMHCLSEKQVPLLIIHAIYCGAESTVWEWLIP